MRDNKNYGLKLVACNILLSNRIVLCWVPPPPPTLWLVHTAAVAVPAEVGAAAAVAGAAAFEAVALQAVAAWAAVA
jgi:hypothetical protein